MKVLYICPGRFTEADGVYQKARKRSQYWSCHGAETYLYTYNDFERDLCWWERLLLKIPSRVTTLLYQILFSRRVDLLCRDFQPDVLYTRHFLWPYLFDKRPKLVLEVNGDITAENRKLSWPWQALITRSIAYYNSNASGLVLVAPQLGNEFSSIAHKVVMPNSILATSSQVLANFNKRTLRRESIQKQKAICFMATKARFFYDIDFIVRLVSSLNETYQLWVVGDLPLEQERHENKSNVHFLGRRSEAELEEILQDCTLAIGATDFYPAATASPLKTRTYLEYGVPVLSSDFDIDFDNTTPYYRGVPYDGGDKDIEKYSRELEDFLQSREVRDIPELEQLPKKIAETCLDYREEKILKFFETLKG